MSDNQFLDDDDDFGDFADFQQPIALTSTIIEPVKQPQEVQVDADDDFGDFEAPLTTTTTTIATTTTTAFTSNNIEEIQESFALDEFGDFEAPPATTTTTFTANNIEEKQESFAVDEIEAPQHSIVEEDPFAELINDPVISEPIKNSLDIKQPEQLEQPVQSVALTNDNPIEQTNAEEDFGDFDDFQQPVVLSSTIIEPIKQEEEEVAEIKEVKEVEADEDFGDFEAPAETTATSTSFTANNIEDKQESFAVDEIEAPAISQNSNKSEIIVETLVKEEDPFAELINDPVISEPIKNSLDIKQPEQPEQPVQSVALTNDNPIEQTNAEEDFGDFDDFQQPVVLSSTTIEPIKQEEEEVAEIKEVKEVEADEDFGDFEAPAATNATTPPQQLLSEETQKPESLVFESSESSTQPDIEIELASEIILSIVEPTTNANEDPFSELLDSPADPIEVEEEVEEIKEVKEVEANEDKDFGEFEAPPATSTTYSSENENNKNEIASIEQPQQLLSEETQKPESLVFESSESSTQPDIEIELASEIILSIAEPTTNANEDPFSELLDSPADPIEVEEEVEEGENKVEANNEMNDDFDGFQEANSSVILSEETSLNIEITSQQTSVNQQTEEIEIKPQDEEIVSIKEEDPFSDIVEPSSETTLQSEQTEVTLVVEPILEIKEQSTELPETNETSDINEEFEDFQAPITTTTTDIEVSVAITEETDIKQQEVEVVSVKEEDPFSEIIPSSSETTLQPEQTIEETTVVEPIVELKEPDIILEQTTEIPETSDINEEFEDFQAPKTSNSQEPIVSANENEFDDFEGFQEASSTLPDSVKEEEDPFSDIVEPSSETIPQPEKTEVTAVVEPIVELELKEQTTEIPETNETSDINEEFEDFQAPTTTTTTDVSGAPETTETIISTNEDEFDDFEGFQEAKEILSVKEEDPFSEIAQPSSETIPQPEVITVVEPLVEVEEQTPEVPEIDETNDEFEDFQTPVITSNNQEPIVSANENEFDDFDGFQEAESHPTTSIVMNEVQEEEKAEEEDDEFGDFDGFSADITSEPTLTEVPDNEQPVITSEPLQVQLQSTLNEGEDDDDFGDFDAFQEASSTFSPNISDTQPPSTNTNINNTFEDTTEDDFGDFDAFQDSTQPIDENFPEETKETAEEWAGFTSPSLTSPMTNHTSSENTSLVSPIPSSQTHITLSLNIFGLSSIASNNNHNKDVLSSEEKLSFSYETIFSSSVSSQQDVDITSADEKPSTSSSSSFTQRLTTCFQRYSPSDLNQEVDFTEKLQKSFSESVDMFAIATHMNSINNTINNTINKQEESSVKKNKLSEGELFLQQIPDLSYLMNSQ